MISDDIKMPVADTSDTFILENGGSSIKAGFSSQSTPRNHTESQIKFNPLWPRQEFFFLGGGAQHQLRA